MVDPVVAVRSGAWRDVASVFLALFCVAAAVNVQAPLFPVYAARAGFGPSMVSWVFGAYVLGVFPPLLFLGGLSDRLGQKPVMLAALAVSGAATLLVLARPSLDSVLVARVLQGLAIAAAMPAATTWVAARETPERGAAVTAAASTLGFGAGAALTSVVTDGVSPVPLSYPILSALIAASFLALTRAPVGPQSDRAPLVSRPLWPAPSRGPSLALGLGWGVAGLVISALPSVLGRLDALAWSGPSLLGMLVLGWAVQRHARTLPSSRALRLGALIQSAAMVVLLLGVRFQSASAVCAGAAFGGAASHGYTLAGGLAEATRRASPRDLSRVTAGYFFVAYLGFAGLSLGVGPVAESWGMPLALTCAAVVLWAGEIAVFLESGRSSKAPPRVP